VGLWVRLKLTETPAFAAAIAHEAAARRAAGRAAARPLEGHRLRHLAAVCCFAVYYLMTAFALGYGVNTLGYSRTAMLSVQLIAILFMAGGIVVAGYWADATNPRRVLMAGCAMTVGVGALLPVMMGPARCCRSELFLAWACWSWASSTDRWAPSCPTCSRPGCATPAPRRPSTSAASWAAAWPRDRPGPGRSGRAGVAGLVSLLALLPLKKTTDEL
jgi:hypothetical protein